MKYLDGDVLRKKLFRTFCAKKTCKKYFSDHHDIMIYQKDILDCHLFSLQHQEAAVNFSEIIETDYYPRMTAKFGNGLIF